MGRVKSLILDFGNVIAFFDHRKACRQLASLATKPVSEDAVYAEVFGTPLHADFDCGGISGPAFVERLRTRFQLASSDQAIVTAWCDIFVPNEEVISLLPRLKRAAAGLYLASNTDDLHFAWVRRQFAESLALFDGFTLSFELGTRKPAAAFFERCVEATGATPSECVFVDDRGDFVDVARNLGMTGVIYRPGMDLARALEAAGVPL